MHAWKVVGSTQEKLCSTLRPEGSLFLVRSGIFRAAYKQTFYLTKFN